MTNDEGFIEEMQRNNFYIGDKVMTALISRYNKKYDDYDAYVIENIDLNLIWDKILKKIFQFYKENGYVDDSFYEKLDNWIWKNYKNVAYPYHDQK